MANALDEPFVAGLSGSAVAEALDGVLRRSRDIAAAAGDPARLTLLAQKVREELVSGVAARKDASDAGALALNAATRTVLGATAASSGTRSRLASAFLRAYVAAVFAHLASAELSRSLGRGRFIRLGHIAGFVQDVQRHVEGHAPQPESDALATAEDVRELQTALEREIARVVEHLRRELPEDAG
ncbi:MAG: hypothetical protein ACE5O2_14760 [Armatimonadota bacterium]